MFYVLLKETTWQLHWAKNLIAFIKSSMTDIFHLLKFWCHQTTGHYSTDPKNCTLNFPFKFNYIHACISKDSRLFFHHQIIGSTVSSIFFRIYFDLTHVLIINVFRFQKRFQIEDSKNNKLLLAADVSEEE